MRLRFFEDKKCTITSEQIHRKFTFTIVILIFLSAYVSFVDTTSTNNDNPEIYLITSTFIGLLIISYALYNFKELNIGPQFRTFISIGLNWFILIIGLSTFIAALILDNSYLSTIAANLIIFTFVIPTIIIFIMFWTRDMSD